MRVKGRPCEQMDGQTGWSAPTPRNDDASAMHRNEVLTYSATWVSLENAQWAEPDPKAQTLHVTVSRNRSGPAVAGAGVTANGEGLL